MTLSMAFLFLEYASGHNNTPSTMKKMKVASDMRVDRYHDTNRVRNTLIVYLISCREVMSLMKNDKWRATLYNHTIAS